MVANPMYGRNPETDVEQLRALRLVPRGEWRGPGCGDRCVRVFAEVMGGGHREMVEAHDGAAHEAYVHSLYLPEIVRTGCLTVDIKAGRFWVGDEEVRRYRPQSWDIIRALAQRVGMVVSKQRLWADIHGNHTPMIRSDSYFGALLTWTRRDLGHAGDLIETRFNLGYMLRAEPPIGPGGER